MNRRRAFFLALLTVSLAAFGACDNEPVTSPPPAGYVPTYPADYYDDASADGARGTPARTLPERTLPDRRGMMPRATAPLPVRTARTTVAATLQAESGHGF